MAQVTLRKVVKKYSMFGGSQHYLVVDDFDPRIHSLYFCPQLYKYDQDKLVPLQGEEIGKLIAQSLEAGAKDRRPWYEPLEKAPVDPIIDAPLQGDFDAVVVEMPVARGSQTRQRTRNDKPVSDGE